MLFFCTCTLYLRNQAHVQRTYKQIFLQNQVRTPAYTHKKSYVTSADMNKSVTLAQTHTHTHTRRSVSADTCTHTFTHPHTTDRHRQWHTHTHNHGQAVSHTQSGNNHVCFVLPPLPLRSDILRDSVGWGWGQEVQWWKTWVRMEGEESQQKVRWSRVSEGKRVQRKDLCKV